MVCWVVTTEEAVVTYGVVGAAVGVVSAGLTVVPTVVEVVGTTTVPGTLTVVGVVTSMVVGWHSSGLPQVDTTMVVEDGQ